MKIPSFSQLKEHKNYSIFYCLFFTLTLLFDFVVCVFNLFSDLNLSGRKNSGRVDS